MVVLFILSFGVLVGVRMGFLWGKIYFFVIFWAKKIKAIWGGFF